MKIHPLLQDPNAVLVYCVPLHGAVNWVDYRRASCQVMRVMRIELEGEKVVFKPNVTSGERFANPDTGITTHPGFLEGMIEYLRQGGTPAGRMTIVEDPRDTDDNHPRHWRGTGYERLSQESGVRLHCPTTFTCVKKTVAEPQVFAQMNVSRLAVATDTVVFNVPKLKTHNLGITTLSMKNLMGLVNVFDRHYCHQAWMGLPEEIRNDARPRGEWFDRTIHELWQTGLARRLIDTAQVIQPAVNIVEGIVGREGSGFQRGRNRVLGLIIGGINMVAVDSVASYIMGFDPRELIYLKLAYDAGLGCNDIGKLKIYTEQQGELTLCSDPASLRVSPPFRVITNTLGEDPDPFQNEDRTIYPGDYY
jgi:uncharacterized protein (DUF362 family)